MRERKRPSITEIKEQHEKCKRHYSTLFGEYDEDQVFYDLLFKDRLHVATEFDYDRIVLPTARDVVDVAVNHTDITNARVFVNKKSTGDVSVESAEMLRKLGLGVIHMTNVESKIAPGHVAAKHYWIHGLAVLKVIWEADRWPDKPRWEEGESEEKYAKKIDEWRIEHHLSIPIVIQAINPSNIMPDPYYGGELYVFETHERMLFDVQRMLPNWKNPLGRKGEDDKVEFISYWDKDYRCELIDGEPILNAKGGVDKHSYGFIPYTLIESGLGNLAKDAEPEKRYVGLLRSIKDLLISESTNYTMCDILMKRETMKGGYITGTDAGDVPDVLQEYGKYWKVGSKDVEFHDWETKLAPEAAYTHLALTHDYIAGHAAPRSVRGLSETGVRSGADRRLVMAEAAAIYRYASPAFAHGWANVLSKCANLVKNVMPGDFEIWTRTPTDEFDVVIKRKLLKEPFNYYVEFAPISEEDEYRRQDSLVKLWNSGNGLITEEFAWKQMSNVDPIAMRKEKTKEAIRNSEAMMQFRNQLIAMAGQQALSGLMPPPIQAGATPSVPSPTAGMEAGRGMVPPIPQRAPLGSMTNLENQWKSSLEGTKSPIQTQGRGGGGS